VNPRARMTEIGIRGAIDEWIVVRGDRKKAAKDQRSRDAIDREAELILAEADSRFFSHSITSSECVFVCPPAIYKYIIL